MHALHDRYVLCKYQPPSLVKALTAHAEIVSEGLLVSVKKLQSLSGLVSRLWHEQDDKKVVGLNAEKHIGVERQVFGGFQSFAVPA